MLKSHTLVLKISLITQILGILAKEGSSRTHSLFNGPHFRVLWGLQGSNPKFDSLRTTAYRCRNTHPNFVLLATVVPEILTRKGGCDVISPLSFIISIDFKGPL